MSLAEQLAATNARLLVDKAISRGGREIRGAGRQGHPSLEGMPSSNTTPVARLNSRRPFDLLRFRPPQSLSAALLHPRAYC